ncbi:sensor histidine kinase [Marinifilum caeruleilacunae]|uniref:Signal transduction histidine kinase internal region domain-containing protein n=1 Tax=Marinifilum caeruleilacunae TaxID=2499076 RepID=A0ABX1WZ66_9BACT|nr:histidine kinase [Marinifilum caeruleilacunae]NOU61406.1 hypothetical protein [Marinifilum caeruleilacunae]
MRQFILPLLVLVVLIPVALLGQTSNNPSNFDQSYWNYIRVKILPPNAKAYRFEKDIRVQLKGNFNKEDSICIQQIIGKLKPLISSVRIEASDSLPNITLWLREGTGARKVHNFYGLQKFGSISSQEYQFSFDQYTQDERNAHLMYYLVRSLSKIQHNPHGDMNITQSIFNEDDPLKSDFIQVDKFLIKKLYSKDFYSQFKSNFNGSLIDYYHYRFGDRIRFASEAIAIILGFVSLLLLLKYRIIQTESKNWKEFIKQGLLIINCILFFYLLSQRFTAYKFISWPNILKIVLLTQILLILELFFISVIERRFSGHKIASKLFVQSVTTSVFTYIFFLIYTPIVALSLSHKIYWDWELSFEQITIIIMIVCFRLTFNFTNFKNIQEVRKRDMELAKLKLLKTKAELQSLQSRINPHFLYNSLNSIATLTHINPEKTEEMALSLSDFFRYAINHKDQDMIEVQQEVEIARTYLHIEKVRFGDRLEFYIEIEDSILKNLVPRFLIQPLIENSIKHGISAIQEKGIIKLEITKQSGYLHIRVQDNGPAFPDTPVSGYGLRSLYEKLELIYGGSAQFSWQNQPEKSICIRLPLSQKPITHEN